MNQQTKNTKNPKEKKIAFVHVFMICSISIFICCLIISCNQDNQTKIQKKIAIAKMDRIQNFRLEQNKQFVIIDSIYCKIKNLDPSINAGYEENDIKFYLNEIQTFHRNNVHDDRYKIYAITAEFYTLWLMNKKELWSILENTSHFRKNLEECEIGLQKKITKLKHITE